MKTSKPLKRASLIVIAILLITTLATPVLAFESRGGDNVVIAAGEVIEDDLYVMAGTFILDGTIKGDLVVFGATITINGTVEEDLLAAGQSIIINGVVEDDARIGGSTITLSSGATIGDDLVAGAYSLETKPDSSIEGDVAFGGFQAQLAGDIAGNVIIAGNSVALNGSIGGDVEAEVGEAGAGPPFSPFMFMPDAPQLPTVPGGLTVSPDASIGGTLRYTGPAEADVPSGIADDYTPIVSPEAEVAQAPSVGQRILNWVLYLVRSVISLLIVGLLIIWLLPKCVKRYADVLAAKPLPSLGWGIVALFAIPLAILIIGGFTAGLAVIFGVITIGSLSLTIIMLGLFLIFSIILATYLVAVWGAKIVVSIWLGRLIAQQSSTNLDQNRFWSFLIGLVIIVLLSSIPILGGLLSFVIFLLGLGALVLWFWQIYKGETTSA